MGKGHFNFFLNFVLKGMTIGFLITYLTGQEIYYFRLDFLGIGILKGVSLARVAEILIYGKYILFYA